MTWAVCSYCDIRVTYSYLRLTEDGEIRCAECLRSYTSNWQDDRIEELLKENRDVTRERDRLLAVKWGLASEYTDDLDGLRARVADLQGHPEADELNAIMERLEAAVRWIDAS